MINSHYPCSQHPKFNLDFLCLDQTCTVKGLVCQDCLIGDHKTHQYAKIDEYLTLIRQKQCSDADILKLKQIYQQMNLLIDRFISNFTQQLNNFRQQLQNQLQKEIASVERMKEFQKEQMKILNRCEKMHTSSTLSTALVELTDFNQESSIFQHYEVIKKLINKNQACAQNMGTEGTKIVKDFSAYLSQLVRYLEKETSQLHPEIQFGSITKTPIVNFDSNHQHQRANVRGFTQTPANLRAASEGGQNSTPNDMFNWKSESIIQVLQSDQQEKVEKTELNFEVPSSPKTEIHDLNKYNYITNFQKHTNPVRSSSSNVKPVTASAPVSQIQYNPHYGVIHDQLIRDKQKEKASHVEPVDFYQEIKNSSVRDSNPAKARSRILTENPQYQPNEIAQLILQDQVQRSKQSSGYQQSNKMEQPSFQDQQFESNNPPSTMKRNGPSNLQLNILRSNSSSSQLFESRIIQNQNEMAAISRSGLHQKIGADDYSIYKSPAKISNTPLMMRQSASSLRSSIARTPMNHGKDDLHVLDSTSVPVVESTLATKVVIKAHQTHVSSLVKYNSLKYQQILDNVIYSSGEDGYLKSFGLSNGAQLSSVQVAKDAIMCLSVFRDKSSLFAALGCHNGLTIMFQFVNNNWKKIQSLKVLKFSKYIQNDSSNKPISSIAFVSQLNSYLFTFTQGGEIAIYNWLSSKRAFYHLAYLGDSSKGIVLPIHTCAISIQSVTRKSQVVLMVGGGVKDGIVSVWTGDLQLQLTNQHQFQAHSRPVTRIDFSFEYLVTAAKYDDCVKLWDILNYTIKLIIKEQWTILNVSISHNTILICSFERKQDKTRITQWDLGDTTKYQLLAHEPGKFSKVYYDGKNLALGDIKGDVILL